MTSYTHLVVVKVDNAIYRINHYPADEYYNLGQIKWNIETTPPPKISDGKMARFGLHAPSSLIWGRGGISVPFYSVQDCSKTN